MSSRRKKRHVKSHSKAPISQTRKTKPLWESSTAGLLPGTLVEIPGQAPPKIDCLHYSTDLCQLSSKLPFILEAIVGAEPGAPRDPTVWWINIENPNPDVLASLSDDYGIHPLVLEDVQNSQTRPKFDEYGKYLYVSIQRASYLGRQLEHEAVHLITGQNFLISFFNSKDPVYVSLTAKIQNGQGKLRQLGSDYLLFSIMDECIDRFFPIIEEIEGHIEELEATILKSAEQEVLEAILFLKRSVSDMRHVIWPLTEVIAAMQRSPSLFITGDVRLYLRDIVDHGLHLTDLVNSLRDMASNLLELYHSSITSSLNKVIKFLTIISTIFIPPTFIVGLYGMNFKFMPELDSPWGYPIVLIGMGLLSIGMLYYFKRKKWI